MSEALHLLLRLNLAAGAAVVLALLLRRPVRRLFGARVAYGLWVLVPVAAAAMLAPARVVVLSAPRAVEAEAFSVAASAAGVIAPALSVQPRPSLAGGLLLVWAAGAVAALGYLAMRQAQFGRAARAGRAGPAVVGVMRPRIVTPDDFAQRYTPREQQVVLAHEATHIVRQDPRINALVALARCAGWFNPLAHVMAHCLRTDQELACDAQVVAAHPMARRSYAEAMLKTQLAARPLPLGCYWPAQAAHPLAERIRLLSRRSPGRTERALGAAIVALMALAGAWAAWAARPAEVVVVAPPTVLRLASATAVAAPLPPPAAKIVRLRPATTVRKPPAGLTQVASLPPAEGPLEPAPPPPPPADAAVARSGPGGLMRPGFFGPRRIHSAAGWSAVEPGSAVRVLATMTDPEGIPLVTDLTAFGSQSRYRVGYVERNASRYRLFTSVVQHGDRLLVTAALDRSFRPMVSGSVELASGETGAVKLPNGLQVTVTPTVRRETPEELAEAQRTDGHPYVRLDRVAQL